METESFRERNRLRREQNAFRNLRDYAQKASVPQAEAAAQEMARQIHAPEAISDREGRKLKGLVGPREPQAQGAAKPSPADASGQRGRKPSTSMGAVKEREGAKSSPKRKAPEKGAAGEDQEGTAAASARARGTPKEPEASTEPEAASVPHKLEDRTKEQLYARAQELEIEGRSQMTKEALIEAIRTRQ